MKEVKIINSTNRLPADMVAGWCSSFLCKFRGLMFRQTLAAGSGLLLVEPKDSIVNTSIHMFFMRFDIAVIWINDSGVVVDRCFAKKWITIKAPKEPARYILEIVPDRLDEFTIGDQISFVEV